MVTSPHLDEFWKKALTGAERRQAVSKAPDWACRFSSAYTQIPTSQQERRGLLNAILPLAEAARENVRRAIASSSMTPSSPEQRDYLGCILEKHLFDHLFAATSKTLVLELRVAREHGLLAGDTPEQRYAFFCDCLLDRSFAAGLLSQYPLLVRRIVKLVALWEISTREMLERLAADSPRIRAALFRSHDPGPLVSAEPLGDSHSGGRRVHRLNFASGRKLIYKPRSVAMEHGVYAFTQWLNNVGHSPDLGALIALDCRRYGWTEYTEVAPCSSNAGVRRFFLRQGANIAIAHLLGASDLHYENIIAAGEYPVIVDLETLFHDPTTVNLSPASTAAYQIIGDSVARTLLLPARVASVGADDGNAKPADISALGYVADQQAPYVAHDWADWETDTMHMAEKRGLLPVANCIPTFGGKPVSAVDHVETIVAGFSNTYDLLRRHKKQLLSSARSPLNNFKGKIMRKVFRPTSTYLQLLAQSWHPRFTIDAVSLESHLQSSLPPVDQPRALARAINKAEISELLNGDVPYFRASVCGRLPSPRRANSELVLLSRGWQACRERAKDISLRDKKRQEWITRLSFVDLNAGLTRSRCKPRTVDRKTIRDLAEKIGDRLCELAITKNGHASWLFPIIDDRIHLTPAVVGFDLYDGLSGIALFLGCLSRFTGKIRYRSMAEAGIAEALAILRRFEEDGATPGGFEGSGGLAYALALLGVWLDRPDWLRRAATIIQRQADYAAQNHERDLISGRAGFLLSGIAVAKVTQNPLVLKSLRPCAESLLTLPADLLPPAKDAGLAHGKSGIGLATVRWLDAIGDTDRRDAQLALSTKDLKSAVGKQRQHSGSDTAHGIHDGRDMIAWCRGAVGTSLAAFRLRMPVRRTAEILVASITQRLSDAPGDHALCLCHGLFGITEFLDEAAREDIRGAKTVLELVRREALSRVTSGEFCSDHAHRLDAPGLMKGLAGTGYALLRLLEPDRVPSVLTFDPIWNVHPRATGKP